MRIGFASLLWLAGMAAILCTPVSHAGDPPPIQIKPQRPGETPEKDKEPQDKGGFLIIRPSSKTTTTTQVGEPKQPSGPTVPAAASVMNVPPPGPQPAAATDKDGKKILFDYWFVVGIEGQRAGYVHWNAKEIARDDKQLRVGTRYLNLTISRFGQPSSQWGEETSYETVEGSVVFTSMRQGLSKDQALALTGTVTDGGRKLKVAREGAVKGESEIPWPDGVVGLVREPKLFKELNLKAGESHSYPSYIPTVNWVVKTTITFEGEETKVLWPNTPPKKLLRFISKPAPIGKVKLPTSTTWVDAETFEPLLQEADFLSLGGRLTFLRTTEESAKAPVTRPVEVFNTQSIKLNRGISGIHRLGSVVYKVSAPRDDEPETVFATDFRQKIENLDPKTKTFELRIAASHGPDKNAVALPPPGKEFTESNYFINWDDKLVKAHAKEAVAGLLPTAGAWEKAVAVERWVKLNMKAFEFSQAMAPADSVARSLSGDCTEYSMLAAAMCRALGIPSRTALGVVCVEGKTYLAYHMWFEVFANGQWLPLDATLGLGGIGPGHIKIADHSWYEEKSFAPLLPVLRALCAKPSMEVVKLTP